MREVLEKQLKRFQELEAMMTDPEVLADSHRISAVARERGSLAKVATKYQSFKTTIEEIQGVSEMAQSDDPEEREMAELELPELRAKEEEIMVLRLLF